MNKADLINKIAEGTSLNKQQATDALNAVLNTISNTLQAGDKITLVGFGTFSSDVRAARQGRNPRTGEAIDIPEKKVVKFKPGKELSDAVAQG